MMRLLRAFVTERCLTDRTDAATIAALRQRRPYRPATPNDPTQNTNPQNDNPYDTAQMRHMSDLEHVRERSGMYIGNRDVSGLHHLVSEVVDNSIDEVMAGHATVIQVTVNPDGSITVADDGRGIPVDIDPNIGNSALEGVMTMLKYGGKFDNKAYKTSGGLHGIGVKAVNFLSEWCEVEVRRGGHAYQQEYERGKPTGPVIRVGTAQGTGTKTTFKPDYQVFGDLKFDYNILHKRLQELAFLNRGVKIVFKDLRSGEGETFQYNDGLVEFIRYLNRASEGIHARRRLHQRQERRDRRVEVEVAFQYCAEYTENVHCYANNINTIDGGTHLTGFRTALTRTLERLRQEGEHLQGHRAHGRGPPRGPHGDRLGAAAEPAVRIADQGQAQQPGGGRRRQLGRRRLPGQVPGRASQDGQADDRQGRAGGRGPRGGPQGQGPPPRPQGHPGRRRAAGQAPRLHAARSSSAASCTWSRAIRPAAAPRAAATASSRPSSPCAARSSTPTSPAKTRCWPTRKSAA